MLFYVSKCEANCCCWNHQYFFVNSMIFSRAVQLQRYTKMQKRYSSSYTDIASLRLFIPTESSGTWMFLALRGGCRKRGSAFRSCTSSRTLWEPKSRRSCSFVKQGRETSWLKYAFISAARSYPNSARDIRRQISILIQ